MEVLSALRSHGIELKRQAYGQHRARCPRCDRVATDTALAVRIDECGAVWSCHRCMWTGSTRQGVRADRSITPSVVQLRRDADQRTAANNRIAARIWAEADPLARTLGAGYLKRRACVLPPVDGDLRFHRSLWCAPLKRELPALVARVSTAIGNRDAGVHRIYLDPRGSDKAIEKMRLGGAADAVCVRLWPDAAVELTLGIAEGIETALAAAQLHRHVWAAIDAGQLERFPVLPGVETLTVFADHDRRGIESAARCADRWRDAGREVTAIAPAQPGADFNDAVRCASNG